MSNSLLKSEKVLVALKDKKLAMEFIEKWREHFSGCELHFNFVEDGIKAVQEAKFNSPALAIIDDEVASKNGLDLANSLLQSYGQIQILIVSNQDFSASSFPSLRSPITDWTQATHLMASLLPGDFLQENNIQLGDPILKSQLQKYSQKYRQDSNNEGDSATRKIFINSPPSFLQDFAESSSQILNPAGPPLADGTASSGKVHLGEKTQKQQAPPNTLNDFQMMLGEVIVIGFLAINLAWIGLPKEDDLLLVTTFKIILIGLLGFSILGFFALRWVKRKREI